MIEDRLPGAFSPARIKLALLAAVIALLALLPYLAGGVSRSFIVLDDGKYIYENPQVRQGLSLRTALWALTSTEHANWYPLRRLSHLADVSLFGLDARGHHLVSVLWHAAAALLLFAALRLLTGMLWRSFVVAGLFAAHPLQVESVAWASERSSVLSGFFFALTLLLWARYARRPGPGRYLALTAACALGLMAKPVLVTLPFVLLLLDCWPLGRVSPPGSPPARLSAALVGRRLLEKAPLLLLAAGSGALAVVAHREAGALTPLDSIPFGGRLGNAALSYVRYIGSLLWPADLAVLYPYERDLPPAAVLAATLLLAAATALALLQFRRRPWLAAGWLWYVGMLLPMIGIVQFGAQARADRFVYLPAIGLLLALVWSAAEATPPGRLPRAALGLLAGTALSALAAAGAVQAGHWKDSETLFRRSLSVTKDNALAHSSLGLAILNRGRPDEAAAHFREALRLRPKFSGTHDFADAHNNLAVALATMGKREEALAHFREALRLRPAYAKAHYNLGMFLLEQGRREEAARHQRALAAIDADLARRLGRNIEERGRGALR